MTLAQVLQESCKQNNLDPDVHALLLNGKELDLSLTVRLAGILAGQKLSLKRKEGGTQIVNVAVQLPNGERIVSSFSTEQSLWEIIKHCESQKNMNLTELYGNQTPEKKSFFSKPQSTPWGYFQIVCLCLNKEISTNNDLQTTTLKQLGLTSGNALLRLTHKFTPTTSPPNNDSKHDTHMSVDDQNDSQPESAISNQTERITAENTSHTNNEESSNNNNNDDKLPISRDLLVLAPDSKTTDEGHYPDEFYELSMEDYKVLAKQQEDREKEKQFLKTKKLREKELQSKKVKYTKTLIRVKFPDRMEIQGSFSPKETAFSVVQFVKENLHHADVPFFLFLSPPFKTLDETQTLESLGLVPSALVHFSWQKGLDNPPTTFLKPTLPVFVEAKADQTNQPQSPPSSTPEANSSHTI
eukprot:CAMPEP_0168563782 /NCGR_PEP_ID=MMETSP0413-20121227/12864_1 /TAXON_ID=136452 /ORGANISM="Filamoeba nolandi, Strain NC-AS-23-1" /LENGTH=411 /DNA_ID=CAMNT_0008595347 /DNA_START=9 /DNA_END=1241 /DNA_ORIENTATION=+